MRPRSIVVPALAAALAAAAAGIRPAAGQPYPMPVSPPPPPPERSVSLTISPLHLLFPLAELTAELRVGRRLGVAAIGGVGTITASSGTDDLRMFASEVGASVRYYATGSFARGLQVGAELLYVHVSVDDSDGDVQLTGAGQGMSVGPFVGYKWTARNGFTFDGQGGLAVIAVRANASDGSASASSEESRVYPLLNVNVGWSF